MARVGNATVLHVGVTALPRNPELFRRLRLILALVLAWSAVPALGASNVRISGLTDLAFGTITALGSDNSRSESLCLYSSSPTSGYRVTATGTGTGGAFTLASGANTLAYEVQWNAQSGQTSGSQLTAGVPLTGLVSSATQQQCNSGPASSASLILVLRSAALSTARAGTYNGTLTLLIAPE